MKSIRICFIVSVCILCLCTSVSAESTYPLLYMKQGDVDARALLAKLAPSGTDVDAVISNKQVLLDYGEDIDGIRAQRNVYSMDGITVYINEPSGDIIIDWASAIYTEYELIDQQQHAKYDPDYTGQMADGTTPLISRTNYIHYGEAGFENYKVDQFVHTLAELLEIDLSPNPEWGYTYTEVYPDGQHLSKGVAIYAIVRNNLPVETQGLWSEISVNGYYIEGEKIQVVWYGDTVVRVYLSMYQIEKEQPCTLLTEDMAREIIGRELQQKINTMGEPVVDLCYMPTFDPQGARYAIFVPAWRYRYNPIDTTIHRVNAYTGEIIR